MMETPSEFGGYVGFLSKVLNDFHAGDAEARRRWCKAHLGVECENCGDDKAWCVLHPRFDKNRLLTDKSFSLL